MKDLQRFAETLMFGIFAICLGALVVSYTLHFAQGQQSFLERITELAFVGLTTALRVGGPTQQNTNLNSTVNQPTVDAAK